MKVDIALPLRMGNHVYRHSVNTDRNICSMIAIETTKEYVFSLAPTLVLGNK
jgi:hypothetical protein